MGSLPPRNKGCVLSRLYYSVFACPLPDLDVDVDAMFSCVLWWALLLHRPTGMGLTRFDSQGCPHRDRA
jgi:hypothetical protein